MIRPALLAVALVTGCEQAWAQAGSSTALAMFMVLSSQASAEDAGSALRMPDDVVLTTLQGVGTQNYECRADQVGKLVWTFKAPQADLILGNQIVGRHYAGPTWEYRDGSKVVGKVISKVDGPIPARDVPWLRLEVTSHGGDGAIGQTDVVLRLDTEGGALTGPCGEAGTVKEVPYRAQYVFIRRPQP